jgi:hypothetical protein
VLRQPFQIDGSRQQRTFPVLIHRTLRP